MPRSGIGLNELLGLPPIRRVVYAVIGGHVWNGKRVDSLKAAHVIPILLGVGATLVVRVDAAVGAEGGVASEVGPGRLVDYLAHFFDHFCSICYY